MMGGTRAKMTREKANLEVGRALDICQDQRVLNKAIIKFKVKCVISFFHHCKGLFFTIAQDLILKIILYEQSTHNVHGPFIAVKLKNALAL